MIAHLSVIKILPNRVPNIYAMIKNIASKLHNKPAITAFVKNISL